MHIQTVTFVHLHTKIINFSLSISQFSHRKLSICCFIYVFPAQSLKQVHHIKNERPQKSSNYAGPLGAVRQLYRCESIRLDFTLRANRSGLVVPCSGPAVSLQFVNYVITITHSDNTLRRGVAELTCTQTYSFWLVFSVIARFRLKFVHDL